MIGRFFGGIGAVIVVAWLWVWAANAAASGFWGVYGGFVAAWATPLWWLADTVLRAAQAGLSSAQAGMASVRTDVWDPDVVIVATEQELTRMGAPAWVHGAAPQFWALAARWPAGTDTGVEQQAAVRFWARRLLHWRWTCGLLYALLAIVPAVYLGLVR